VDRPGHVGHDPSAAVLGRHDRRWPGDLSRSPSGACVANAVRGVIIDWRRAGAP
jgi:hypothetical protein